MDGIPPSACPTGIYRPPIRPPTLADASWQLSSADRRATSSFGWLRTLVRRLLGRGAAAPESREIGRG